MLGCDRNLPILDNKNSFTKWKKSQDLSPALSPCDLVRGPTEPLIHRVFSSFEGISKEDSTRIAVIEGTNNERTLTKGELHIRLLATASFLRSHGFGSGDRAMIAIRNTLEFPIFYLGVWAAGGIVIGSSVIYTAHETQYQLVDCSPKIILTTEEYLPTMMAVLERSRSVKMVICIRNTSSDLPIGVIDFNTVINYKIDGEKPQAHIDDVALIYYSSGTTGLRKGVIHTHRSIHTAAEVMQSHWRREIYPVLGMDEWDINEDYQFVTAPCVYLMGLNLFNAFLISGSPIVILNGFHDGNLLACVKKYKPSYLIGYPSMIIHLSKQETADLSSIKLVVSSGSYLRQSVADSFLLRYPHVDYIVQAYGMSELSLCHVPVLFHKGYNSSVGVAAATYQRKIINPESLDECKQGERGELLMKGPAQAVGYLNRADTTENLFNSEGWIKTGDIGYTDELGQLHIVDRIKDLIKINHNDGSDTVSPSEIEDVILTCSKVADVGVVGIPDEERESEIRAYVVKADDSLTAEDVERVVKEMLTEHKFISGGVRFIDKIPRSPNGKMLRRELLSLAQFELNADTFFSAQFIGIC